MKFLSQEVGDDRKVKIVCINDPHVNLFRIEDERLRQIANDSLSAFTPTAIEMECLRQRCARAVKAKHQQEGAFSILVSELDLCINEILSPEGLLRIRGLRAGSAAVVVPVVHHASPLSQTLEGVNPEEETSNFHP